MRVIKVDNKIVGLITSIDINNRFATVKLMINGDDGAKMLKEAKQNIDILPTDVEVSDEKVDELLAKTSTVVRKKIGL